MDLFKQSLLNWQFFFATLATASATLTGLLFVSLSLNRERLKGDKAPLIVSIARDTFADFLYVMMIALVFLVPHLIPVSLTVALLALGIGSCTGLIFRELKSERQGAISPRDIWLISRRIGLPAIASIGLIIVAIEIMVGNYDAIYGLVGVIAALLITACWNAWLLLLEE
jgi:hypothetical protein